MKKKVLFIYYQNIKQGGISKSISHISKSLVENGYDVTVLFLMNPHQDFFPIDSRVKKIYINSFDTKYFRTFSKLNKKSFIRGGLQKIVYYAYDYGCYKMLRKWIEENHKEYDTIFTCWYKLSTYLTFTEAYSKTIAWEHINHKTGGVIYFNLLRKRYKKLKGIICLTENSVNFYKNLNSNLIKIPNIIGDQFENCECNIEKKENRILLASRLDPEKNVKEFLDIVHEAKLPSDWKITIAGTGIEANEIEKYAKKLNIPNLFFVGSISSEQMLEYYKKSKIFCMTSLSEGLPTTLIEAMFCSNVLVSYDCPTGPSEILNEKNGFLIPLRDKQTFKNKLNLLIQNPKILSELMKSSHEEAKKWNKEEILAKWKFVLNTF